MNKIVDKYLAAPAQQCADLSGAALGYANCFTAFLVLVFGGLLSLAVLAIEILKDRASSSLGFHFEKDVRDDDDDHHHLHYYGNLSKEEMRMMLVDKDRYIKGLLEKKKIAS